MIPNFEYLFWTTYNYTTGKWTVSYATVLIVPMFIVSYPTLSPIWDMLKYSEELQFVYQFGNYGIFPKGSSSGYFQLYHEIDFQPTHLENLSEREMRVVEYRLYHQYNYRAARNVAYWPLVPDLKHILSEAGYREYLLSILLEDLKI